ncbi:MAG: DUF1080 domain-containing protein [Planctomycetes bacterium]|nr:DUF1080 domain-containing protein [Planctomycetota bacterium]MCB9870373.1 DUF1080 domain-containing protein [Planctomycetota bacterium]
MHSHRTTFLPALAALAALTGLPAQSAKPAEPKDPYGMRTWYLVLLLRGPAYATLTGPAREKAMAGHFANMRRLAELGTLRLAGPFGAAKQAPQGTKAGLFLLDVRSREEAEKACQTDPSVRAGLFTVEVLSWYGPSDITYRGDKARTGAVPLFNGKDLAGWHADVPAADGGKQVPASFTVRNGLLVSRGTPAGHLITDASYRDYRLVVEYRWPGKPGNCGVLVHASTPRMLYKMFPQSIECQMHHGNAGDFWCIGEDIEVPDMERRRGPKAKWGVTEGKARRIRNLTDGSEKAPGEWNRMVIECRGRSIEVWVNGDKVNSGARCTADHGHIAIQAEGAECEFRKVELTRLAGVAESAPGKKVVR